MTDQQRAKIILASGSAIRAQMLRNAGIIFTTALPRVDEEAIRASLLAEAAGPHDIADHLAEVKARKTSDREPDALVIGADQLLELDGQIFAKPETPQQAIDQLAALSGKTHKLFSAAVVYENGQPLWRHVGTVRLTMHDTSVAYRADYVARNWDTIRHSVGCYLIEAEGIRLFSRIDGDFFNIQGLPLIELLTWLRIRGEIAS
jgi:septum formation protein